VSSNPFELKDLLREVGLGEFTADLLGTILAGPLGFKKLAADYTRTLQIYNEANGETISDIAQSFLDANQVTYELPVEAAARIPKTGPLVVVANHPYGGIEALILLRLIHEVRPDAKFLANYILDRIPRVREFCIYVNPFGGERASKQNLKPLRAAINHLRAGGALCVFPSGTVSHLHPRKLEITDPAWSATVGRLIRSGNADSLPIFFPGSNRWPFQLLGLIHPLLRTLMLARELTNKTGQRFKVKVGNVIPHERSSSFKTDEELITYLRMRTYILGNEKEEEDTAEVVIEPRVMEEIIPPVPLNLIERDIAGLEPRQLLAEMGDFQVYSARAKEAPNVLREIGRLREVTFRKVQEGSGKSIDLDSFDRHYIHLFIWHRANREIVGAYRLGRADSILRHFGKEGLYTSTLFEYKEPVLEQIGSAIEVGRSFVRSEYQRSYTPLLLLWRGIGQFVVNRPRYHTLFGTVSINNEYDAVSRELIRLFLRVNNYLPDLAKWIRARNPMAKTKVRGVDAKTTEFIVKDPSDISELLHDLESEQKHLPILLKQYLKLGGRLMGFNLDPGFGDVLDGLIFVDLRETDPKMLERYMGKEGARSFLTHHGKLG
jgi:putative hemolysin